MKERFEMIWYVVSLSLIPIGLLQFLDFWLSRSSKPLHLLAVCIIMFVLRWLVTGRHLHIPFTKPGNIIIGVFFLITFFFWLIVADEIIYYY